ncbi:NUMOD4 motif-containing HNH endonuclease [Prescottella equi]|uniref:NUMOD4 motif-containing HNH endonuclease n=1 Tax=Rhodococcus hoagii TaxID=43767 RepID=UPI001981BF60|nr:hypothetical protein [Prescottella equi]NKT21584.1 hypothetical protein [Prescottella equi]NKU52534.1 hypothetical protein [Prescottella equi]NKU94080.1 hypothetical protein [Prescottella equi]
MNTTQEEWLPIPGYEGAYDVSSAGRVRGIPRMRIDRLGRRHPIPGGILVQHRRASGHLQVGLSLDGAQRTFTVHRLVAIAFLGPARDGLEVCHNNGNPSDNRVDNLRWDSRNANRLDAVRHGVDHNASKTHCVNGHPFDAANTYVRPDGHRGCRTCRTENANVYRELNREQVRKRNREAKRASRALARIGA